MFPQTVYCWGSLLGRKGLVWPATTAVGAPSVLVRALSPTYLAAQFSPSPAPCAGLFPCGYEINSDAAFQLWYHPWIFSVHIWVRESETMAFKHFFSCTKNHVACTDTSYNKHFQNKFHWDSHIFWCYLQFQGSHLAGRRFFREGAAGRDKKTTNIGIQGIDANKYCWNCLGSMLLHVGTIWLKRRTSNRAQVLVWPVHGRTILAQKTSAGSSYWAPVVMPTAFDAKNHLPVFDFAQFCTECWPQMPAPWMVFR